jgi:hypothetical protein
VTDPPVTDPSVTEQSAAPATAPVTGLPASVAARPGRERTGHTVGDLMRSLAVVLAFVGILVAFNVIQQPDPVVRDVDYPAALLAAQPGASYDLAGPDPLPPGWRVTSARTGVDQQAATWHLGMVTASGTYAAVEQSDGSPRELVARHARGSRPAGNMEITGASWQRRQGGHPEPRALLRRHGAVTTMVVGTARWGELRLLASLLS